MVEAIDEADLTEPVIGWLNTTPVLSLWDRWFASPDLDDHTVEESIHHHRRRKLVVVDRDRRM